MAGASLLPAQQALSPAVATERALRHASPEWQLVAGHLPDLDTATEAALETEAEVLQARRMPEDALEYYGYALRKGGGDQARIFRRMGVAQLELHQPELARACFRRAIQLKKKDAESWNDLGASEYMARDVKGSVPDYQRAIKLNKRNPIYHANLGTTYFELQDYDMARVQFNTASKLDPEVFSRGGWGGTQIEVLSTQNRGRFCFEMARVAARAGNDKAAVEWLGKAAEAGYGVKNAIAEEKDFAAYRKDPRLTLIIENALALHAKHIASSEPVPTLPPGEGKAKRLR